MNTNHCDRPRRLNSITLDSSEIFPLKRPPSGTEIEITVKNGIIRIAGEHKNHSKDLTLAFACKMDTFKFQYPAELELHIEAITEATYYFESDNKTVSENSDAIMDWLIQFHVIRHEANLERRLMKLFQLLMTRMGKRTPEGMILEYSLSHGRIAEILGSTRSTISRTIGTLRKTNQIYVDEVKKQIIIPVK